MGVIAGIMHDHVEPVSAYDDRVFTNEHLADWASEFAEQLTDD